MVILDNREYLASVWAIWLVLRGLEVGGSWVVMRNFEGYLASGNLGGFRGSGVLMGGYAWSLGSFCLCVCRQFAWF